MKSRLLKMVGVAACSRLGLNEGAVQIIYTQDGFDSLICGAVGKLQFEVIQYRSKDKYQTETTLRI